MSEPPVFPSTSRCPECEYDLRGASRDRLGCPECGCIRSVVAMLRPSPPEPGRSPRRFAMVGLLLFIVAVTIGLLYLPFLSCGCRYSGSRAEYRLRSIQRSCAAYEHDVGKPPSHVAELVILGYVEPYDFVGGLALERTVEVGSFDLLEFDGSREAIEGLREEIPRSRGNGDWYRVGDLCFVNNDQAPMNSALVAGWGRPDDRGVRPVIFIDGHIESVHERDWKAVWLADARVRARDSAVGCRPSLRPIEMP